MSAVPRRIEPVSVHSAKPKPKLVARPRGYHHGKTRAEIISGYERSKWAARALSLHLTRVTTGNAQIAWILFVYQHTLGSPAPKERNQEWSPVLLPEDCAKECGLSVQMIRETCNECVALGFTPRMSTQRTSGPEFYRFQVDFDKMAHAKNAFQPRPGAFERKPPKSETGGEPGGEEKANFVDFATTSEQSRETVLSPNPLILAADTVAVAPKLAQAARKVEVSHSLPCDVAIHCTLSDRDLRIHLSPGSAREPIAVGGLKVVESGVRASDPDAPPPNPDQEGLPLTGDSLCDRLAAVGILCEDSDLSRVRENLRRAKCAEGFFLEVVEERVGRLKRGERITARLLPHLITSAAEKWRNGGQKAWESREAGNAAPQPKESYRERKIRELERE